MHGWHFVSWRLLCKELIYTAFFFFNVKNRLISDVGHAGRFFSGLLERDFQWQNHLQQREMVHARKYWLWFSQHFTSIWGQATHIFTLHFLDKGMEKVNIYYGMLYHCFHHFKWKTGMSAKMCLKEENNDTQSAKSIISVITEICCICSQYLRKGVPRFCIWLETNLTISCHFPGRHSEEPHYRELCPLMDLRSAFSTPSAALSAFPGKLF